MIISIVSLVISVLSLAVALFAIFDAHKINKATEELLLKIENTIMEEEQHRKNELTKIRKQIDGKDFDDN